MARGESEYLGILNGGRRYQRGRFRKYFAELRLHSGRGQDSFLRFKHCPLCRGLDHDRVQSGVGG